MAKIPEEWKLSDSQRLDIFNNEIAPREILPHVVHPQTNINSTSNTTPSTASNQKPLAVIIVGQTGAGKTRLAPDLLQAMTTILNSHSNSHTNININTTVSRSVSISPAHLIADTYKTYHPHYNTALTQNPALASPLASNDARTWLSMACHLATRHKLPVLLESACRHPDDFIQLATIFHDAGYITLVAILAVPYPLSRLGILVRYYRDLPEAKSRGLPLRLTPRKVHDDSFSGLEEAASWVDGIGNNLNAVDGVVVVRRTGRVAYRNKRSRRGADTKEEQGGDGKGKVGDESSREWESEPGALKALLLERERELSIDELETARRDIEELRCLEDPKVDEQIQEIEELISGLGKENDVSGSSYAGSSLPLQEYAVFDAYRFVGEFLEP